MLFHAHAAGPHCLSPEGASLGCRVRVKQHAEGRCFGLSTSHIPSPFRTPVKRTLRTFQAPNPADFRTFMVRNFGARIAPGLQYIRSGDLRA